MPRPSADTRSERLRRYWDKHAPKYDKQVASFERWFLGDGRQWVCSQATGEVLEVAIGTGRNLPFYPEGIRLTGIDFSPAMLELARRQADQLGRRVDLRLGDAQALELPDAAFDTVVCTLSLCAIPDERRAVAEMKRVLRPGWPAAAVGPRGRRAAVVSGDPVGVGAGHAAGDRRTLAAAPAAAGAGRGPGGRTVGAVQARDGGAAGRPQAARG